MTAFSVMFASDNKDDWEEFIDKLCHREKHAKIREYFEVTVPSYSPSGKMMFFEIFKNIRYNIKSIFNSKKQFFSFQISFSVIRNNV